MFVWGNIPGPGRRSQLVLAHPQQLPRHHRCARPYEDVDLGELVDQETMSYEVVFFEQGLALDSRGEYEVVFFEQGLALDSRGEEHITVRGNQVELRQVVDILLDNARKYSNPGGKTVVELRREGRRKCVLSVANPGPEIPPEDLAHIFQRFYRIDRARTRTGSFGLGLAIAQSIVLRHRGRIWAQSRQGVNTFSVELPIT